MVGAVTTGAVTTGAVAEPAPARRHRQVPRWSGGAVVVLLVLVVVLQRFLVLPGLPVSLALLLLYVGVAVMALGGHLLLDRMRAELFAVAAVLVLLVTAVAAATGAVVSLTSVGLLLVLWAPWVLRLHPGQQHVQRRTAAALVDLMVVLALVGVGQLLLQFLGVWRYRDHLGDLVPGLLLPGYNTTIPLSYGSPVMKANAFVFLEPSFFSQFCALGALVALVIRQPVWKLLVLVLGVGSAVSGTGIVLLLVGGVLVLLRAPRLLGPGTLLAGGAAACAVLVSPVFPLLLARVGEAAQTGSSGYLRFVQPYTEVAAGLEAAPLRYLLGAGPGSAQRLLESSEGGELGQAVVYAIIPKAIFEYGVVAGGVLVLFIVLAVVDRAPWPVVPGAVLVVLFVLGGNLLAPQTVVVAWLLTSLFTDQGDPAR